MKNVFVLSAVRTAIGKYGGALCDFSAPDLGVWTSRAALEHAGVTPEAMDEVIFGHARQAGNGPNAARQIAVRSGVPDPVPACTVNEACASGMKALVLGYQEIVLGHAEAVLVGGTEAMSRIPYFVAGARPGPGVPLRIAFRPQPAERQRRSHRLGASHRLHGCAHHRDAVARNAEA